MFDSRQAPPTCVYLLGDHLDAALAAGEDLAATSLQIEPLPPLAGMAHLAQRQEELAAFLNRLRTLEAALVARILQARRRAEEAPRSDLHMKPLVSLFLAGTAVLLDAVAEFGDPSGLAFNSGADGLQFLRSRGLVAPDAADLPVAAVISADEDYLVAARVRLGSLMDLSAAFLDALDLRFSLYDEEDVPPELERFVEAAPIKTGKPVAAADDGGLKARSLAAALDALYGPN